ncbi:MAG: hypothetical protein HXX16_11905 [Bacteroidales bacterium]|nr:hypothetical protein [Bacteroidales bacterium]
MNYLGVLLTYLLLVVLHELGHYISANVMKLKNIKAGITLMPYPHPYVTALIEKSVWKKYVFLFSGISMTIIVYLLTYFNLQLKYDFLRIALIIKLCMESNPFYSDFTIAFKPKSSENNNKNITKQIENQINSSKRDYLYSFKWYLHFFVWLVVIILLIAKEVRFH